MHKDKPPPSSARIFVHTQCHYYFMFIYGGERRRSHERSHINKAIKGGGAGWVFIQYGATMKEVRITVDLGIRRYGKYEVALQLDDSVTCGEILQTLFDSLSLHEQEGDKRERWQLVERWRGCGE